MCFFKSSARCRRDQWHYGYRVFSRGSRTHRTVFTRCALQSQRNGLKHASSENNLRILSIHSVEITKHNANVCLSLLQPLMNIIVLMREKKLYEEKKPIQCRIRTLTLWHGWRKLYPWTIEIHVNLVGGYIYWDWQHVLGYISLNVKLNPM